MMPVGAINWYTCPICDGLTVTIHRHAGITPSRIDCRASGRSGDCQGEAASAYYPTVPLPPTRRYAIWAWFAPDIPALMASDTPPDTATLRYLEGGGLLLQPVILTDELRLALAYTRDLQVAKPRRFSALPKPTDMLPLRRINGHHP